MSQPAELHPLIAKTRAGLKQIGYQDNLLLPDYGFSDVLGDKNETQTVSLAAFAQEPTSYKTACFGVAITKSNNPQEIEYCRALGAPMVLAIQPGTNSCRLWKMMAYEVPQLRDEFSADALVSQITSRQEHWRPSEVLRAKNIAFPQISPQLDFYDIGLVAAIEADVHRKLNELLSTVVAQSLEIYKERHDQEPDNEVYRALFQAIFRFMAAKLLGDRKHEGDWLNPDSAVVLQNVNAFYNDPAAALPTIDAPMRNRAWDTIRTAIHFQNLSVEALAYVYENTFVDVPTRRALGTHATPYEVAEYMVRALPIDSLSQDERTVFEPFCGAAPFLVAALGRLRELLPKEMNAAERHNYFVRMLAGMEIDAFAREVAFHSLILADYPNSNGWRISGEDVFASPVLADSLKKSNIVLCNPPYGPFNDIEKQNHAPKSNEKAIQALHNVLRYPPKMLGFVLPLAYQNGRSYRNLRKQIYSLYGNVDVVKLPDNVFQHSSVETVLLLAYGKPQNTPRHRFVALSKSAYKQFKGVRTVAWEKDSLERLWKELEGNSKIASAADIHRGIEYAKGFSNSDPKFVSNTKQTGFVPGLSKNAGNISLYSIDRIEYLTTEAEIKSRTHWAWDMPKLIVPAARMSRGQWVTLAAVDYDGLVCTQSLSGIWLKSQILSLEVLAAVVNGPVANAWMSQRAGKRHSQIRFYASIPIPSFSSTQVELITRYVDNFVRLGKTAEAMSALLKIDAAVLDAYGLSEEAEYELLTWFDGARRPGVPSFTGYGLEFGAARAEYRYELAHFQQVERYQDLVDKTFSAELNVQEAQEKESLSQNIDDYNASFYTNGSQEPSRGR